MHTGMKLTVSGIAERMLLMIENYLIKIVSVFAFMTIGTFAFGGDIEVDMLNKRDDGAKMVYSLDIIDAKAGQNITWLPTSKGHNVEFIAGPDSAELPKKSKLNKKFTHKFDVPGVYLYQCTPHKSMGMIGLVIIDGNTNNKDAIAASKKVKGKSKKKLEKLIAELN